MSVKTYSNGNIYVIDSRMAKRGYAKMRRLRRKRKLNRLRGSI